MVSDSKHFFSIFLKHLYSIYIQNKGQQRNGIQLYAHWHYTFHNTNGLTKIIFVIHTFLKIIYYCTEIPHLMCTIYLACFEFLQLTDFFIMGCTPSKMV